MDELTLRFLEAFVGTFGAIFAIIDPFGYVPVFLTITAKDTNQNRSRMLKRACFAAFCVLTGATFLGDQVLKFFGIGIPALQISGGLLLLVIAFEMLRVIPVVEKLTPLEENEGREKEDISIIPLAIPMLSGPASIAAVVVQTSRVADVSEPWMVYASIVLSVAVTLLFTYFILRSSSHLIRMIGKTGLNVITRVMGLLLSAMAIQFLINGYRSIK